jgi:hypothetical protein
MGDSKSYLKLNNVSSSSTPAAIALLKCIKIGSVQLSEIFYTTNGTQNDANNIKALFESGGTAAPAVVTNAVVSIDFSKTDGFDYTTIATAADATAAATSFGLGDFGITAVKGSNEPVTLTDKETYNNNNAKMAFTGGALEHVENGMTFSFSGGNTLVKNMGGNPVPYKGGKRVTNKKNRKPKGKAKK